MKKSVLSWLSLKVRINFNAQIDLFALSVLPNLPVLVELFRPVGFLTGDADANIIVELLNFGAFYQLNSNLS